MSLFTLQTLEEEQVLLLFVHLLSTFRSIQERYL